MERHGDTFPVNVSPRIGFVGLGWIDLHRMRVVSEAECAQICVLADPQPDSLAAAADVAPQAKQVESFEELLHEELDGIVIATPSALHSEQVLNALSRGLAVFCQKPLARTEKETRQIIEVAEAQNCLLHVDFCYRFVNGMSQARELVRSGQIGKIFLIDLVFHNAYGPDKDWFYDATRSGGGCVIDLGTHLIDLSQWMLGEGTLQSLRSTLWLLGGRHEPQSNEVEDAAIVEWKIGHDQQVRLACSWNLNAGREAVIKATFYGLDGAVALKNVNGSFYDFLVERYDGTQRYSLAEIDSDWGGRAIVNWCRQLAHGNQFDHEIKGLLNVSRIIDEVYNR